MMSQEESDDRMVPEGYRKISETRGQPRQGKAVTASERTRQLELSLTTAENPKGANGGVDVGQPASATSEARKRKDKTRKDSSAVTMEEVARAGNLKKAFERVAANKGAPGVDGQSVEQVRKHLGKILPALTRELLEDRYQPGKVRRVWIPKAGGGERGLGIPNVIDRMIQEAVHQVLSPMYEPTFHRSSHGFRPGRSCHTAVREAVEHVEEGYEWVVDLDLEKFFDRVNHQRLLARLAEKVKDKRVLRLIHRMLKAKVVMPDGVVVSTEEGTPQGGPLSPLLSNIVLDELDRELARRGHRFVRYADDCNIYVSSERAGHRVMSSISRFIEKRLRLQVNLLKSAVARPEERHFLGFRLSRQPLDGRVEVLLSKRSKERIEEAIRARTPRLWGWSLKACIGELNRYLEGWMGFFWICTAAEQRTFHDLDAHIRRRLRVIVLRHWRRRRTMVRRLTRLGVSAASARRNVYSRHSWWALSRTLCGSSRSWERLFCGLTVGLSRSAMGEPATPFPHCPRTVGSVMGIAVGLWTIAGSGRACTWPRSAFRRAGCVAHKSGSVRAGGG